MTNMVEKRILFGVFILSLIIRLIFNEYFSYVNPEFAVAGLDSKEYIYASTEFKALPDAVEKIGKYEWYQRTPAYVLFLSATQRNLLPQMVLSSAGVALMWSMNPVAGLFWGLWFPEMYNSLIYMKYSLYNFFVILVLFLYRNNMKRYFGVLLVTLAFVSYGVVIDYNFTLNHGYMQQPYEIWKPSFSFIPRWIALLWIFPYALLMYQFIRYVPLFSFEVAICLTFTLVYSFIAGNQTFREPLMPIIILWVGTLVADRLMKMKIEEQGISNRYHR